MRDDIHAYRRFLVTFPPTSPTNIPIGLTPIRLPQTPASSVSDASSPLQTSSTAYPAEQGLCDGQAVGGEARLFWVNDRLRLQVSASRSLVLTCSMIGGRRHISTIPLGLDVWRLQASSACIEEGDGIDDDLVPENTLIDHVGCACSLVRRTHKPCSNGTRMDVDHIPPTLNRKGRSSS